jgi:hypothetical protein
MRLKIFVITLFFLLLSIPEAKSKGRCTPVYLFGVSASFTDSIVYITDIQLLDSAWLDEKTNFLLCRNEYSNQLRSHFNNIGLPKRTCYVSFALEEKDILKKYEKALKHYKGTAKKPKKFDIRELDNDDFKFESVKPALFEDENAPVKSKKEKKREEKAKKKQEKKAKKAKEVVRRPGATEDATPPSMPPRH